MIEIVVVDDDNADDFAQQIRENLPASSEAIVSTARSPGELYGRSSVHPALILLDHHWPEINIEHVLERCQKEFPKARLVMFTGKSLEPTAILQCAKYGVAEYLVKGTFGGDIFARHLYMIATDPDCTIEKLSKPIGARRQLHQEFEKMTEKLKVETALRTQLEMQNRELRDSERREIILQFIRFGGNALFLVLAVWLVWFFSLPFGLGVLALVVALLGMLLVDGSAEWIFRITPKSVEIRKGQGEQPIRESIESSKRLTKGAGGAA